MYKIIWTYLVLSWNIPSMNYKIEKTIHGPVSYRILGNGSRKILFYHGFPGSSAQIEIFKSEVKNLDLEVLCIDRPGYNDTSIKTNDSLSDFVKITNVLVQILGWTKFEIVTVSGGTPFGVSYATKNVEKIKNIRVVCGLGNFNVPEIKAIFSKPSLLALRLLPYISGRLIRKALSVCPAEGKPKKNRNLILAFFLPASRPDLELFQNPNVALSLNRALMEALKQNSLGPQQDARAFLKDWSFGANGLNLPVHFWHGNKDHVIPDKIAFVMALQFLNSGVTLVENEGHISLPINHIGSILNFSFQKESPILL